MNDRQPQAPAPTLSGKKPLSSKRNKNRKRIWVWTGILTSLALIGAAAWYLLGGFQPTAAAAQNTVDYYTAPVTRGDLRVSITGTGTLAAYQQIDLSFSAKGTVTELNVKNGDQVTKGQILAKIDNQTTLDAAVASAELEVLQAKKNLAELQQNATLSLAQAYQDWITAQENVKTAKFNLDRTAYARCSQDKNTQLAERLDAAKTKLDNLSISSRGTDAWVTAQSEYDTAVANAAYCAKYTPDEVTNYQAELAIANQTLKAAETKYNTLKEASGIDPTELALDEAAITKAQTTLAEAKENLTGVTLVAPLDGKVIYLAAQKGSSVDTSKYITIADISRPTVNITVDETNLDQLVVGRAIEVTFDSLTDSTFKGQIVQVDPTLSSFGQFGGATAKAELDQTAAAILSKYPLGLSGSVAVIAQATQNALLVPLEALRDLGGGKYAVFVVGSDSKLHLQTVEVGIRDTTRAEITSGLQEGDVVSTGLIQASN
jgi:HlyD family secretion protein